jgi:4-hydroxybenzoate polyprenyltransferase
MTGGGVRRMLARLRIVHPFPSALNAGVVAGFALLAGATPLVAAGLALAMLAIQFGIGATNDLVDADVDRLAQPDKPIPAGLVSRRTAGRLAVGFGGGGLLIAALYGPIVLLIAAAGLAAGLAYDFFLQRGPWGWLAFALGLPLVPVYAWYGAAATLPPRPELLLPLAALAGPALQLANGLVGLEADRRAGLATLAMRLGRRGALATSAALQLLIHGLAWIVLIGNGPATAMFVVAGAGVLAVVGVMLSASSVPARRELGWRAQAGAMGLLAIGWVAGVATS